MGLFDVFKKKAQETAGMSEPAAAPPKAAARAVPQGPTFEWDGEVYPIPSGWSGLSMDDWFLKYTSTIDRISKADEEDLEPMNDEEGEPLSPEEVLLISKLGFQSGGHWEKFRSWGMEYWGSKTGEGAHDIESRMGGIAREKILAKQAAAMSGPGGALSPVEGVDLKTWARLQAGVANGGNFDALLAQAGIDRARWDRVSAEWMARMQTDTTFTIANEYGAAFAGAGQGQFGAQAAHAAAVGVGGDLSDEPMPFERWVEVMEAQNAAAERGEDAAAVLRQFGLSVMDFSNASMFWSKKQQQEAMKYYELYNQYSAKYAAKYRR